MRVQRDNLSLPADEDFAPFVRVTLTAGVIALAGATDNEIGVTAERFLVAEGGKASVTPINATGSIKMTAGAEVAAGALVYGAANGRVGIIANAHPVGQALTAAGAAGDYVEVVPISGLPTA